MKRLKAWHWYSIAALVLVGAPLLWFAMAYGGLPRLWSHHEHRRPGGRGQMVSFTAQGIPGDPLNLRVTGRQDQLVCAFTRAGWYVADPVNVQSALRIGTSVLFQRAYPRAPVSPLYVHDQIQTLAFEKDEGKSADKRHHVRFWRIGTDDWLGAATFDRGVGLSLFTLQITHHIGPDVDAERDQAGRILEQAGARRTGAQTSHIAPGMWHRNGGGDRYRTDGAIGVYTLDGANCR